MGEGHPQSNTFGKVLLSVYSLSSRGGKPSPDGSARLDAFALVSQVSRRGMKTHEQSIPTNLRLGFPPRLKKVPF